jgi:hypothetical protein
VENELAVLGAALLLAGLFARVGRRLGLPTIPFFIVAGIVFGPQTPGIVVLEDPHEIEVLAMLGLVLLLFHLGIEFSVNELLRGGRRLLWAGGASTAPRCRGRGHGTPLFRASPHPTPSYRRVAPESRYARRGCHSMGGPRRDRTSTAAGWGGGVAPGSAIPRAARPTPSPTLALSGNSGSSRFAARNAGAQTCAGRNSESVLPGGREERDRAGSLAPSPSRG